MKIKPFIFVLLVQLYTISGAAPSKCFLWDSKCLPVRAQALSSILAAGNPELDMQPLDTMWINLMHINHIGYRIDIRSTNVKGMSNAVIDKISIDMPSKIVNLVFHTDFVIKSRYVSNGTLLSTPIYGNGNCFMKFENVRIAMKISFDIIKDANEKDIMILKSFTSKFVVAKGAQFHFENLYNGDKYLSDNMHNKMRQKWQYLTITFGKYLFDPIAKKVFDSFRNFVQSGPLGTVAL